MIFWQPPRWWQKQSTPTRVWPKVILKVQWCNPRLWSAESSFNISLLQNIKCLALLLSRTKVKAKVYLKGTEQTRSIVPDLSYRLHQCITLFIHLKGLKCSEESQDCTIQVVWLILIPYIKSLCSAAPQKSALTLPLQDIQIAQAGSNPLGRQRAVMFLHTEIALHHIRAMYRMQILLIICVYLRDAAILHSINLFQIMRMANAIGMGTGMSPLSIGRLVMIPRSKAFKQMVNFLASLPFYHVDHVWEVWIKFSTPCLFHEDVNLFHIKWINFIPFSQKNCRFVFVDNICQPFNCIGLTR